MTLESDFLDALLAKQLGRNLVVTRAEAVAYFQGSGYEGSIGTLLSNSERHSNHPNYPHKFTVNVSRGVYRIHRSALRARRLELAPKMSHREMFESIKTDVRGDANKPSESFEYLENEIFDRSSFKDLGTLFVEQCFKGGFEIKVNQDEISIWSDFDSFIAFYANYAVRKAAVEFHFKADDPRTAALSKHFSASPPRKGYVAFFVTDELPRFFQVLNKSEMAIGTYERDESYSTGAQRPPSLDELDDTAQEIENTRATPVKSFQDARRRVLASIVRRQGQGLFRKQLLHAYKGRCAVTGTDVEEALEAAHIYPYMGPDSNDITNGILLRADIHTLFDLGLITFDELGNVELAPYISGSLYADLLGTPLALPEDEKFHPDERWLAWHRDNVRQNRRPRPIESTQ